MKSPIQLKIPFIGTFSISRLPNRYTTGKLCSAVLKVARENFKVGDSFLWSELRKLCENAGFYPEDEKAGYRVSASYLAKNGFERIGETGRSTTVSRGNAPDSKWKREI